MYITTVNSIFIPFLSITGFSWMLLRWSAKFGTDLGLSHLGGAGAGAGKAARKWYYLF